MEKLNLHASPASFTHASRMLKETKSIADLGIFDKIHVCAIWAPGLKELEELDAKRVVWRVRLITRMLPYRSFWKALQFLEWQLRIFFKFRKKNVHVFNAHSLSVLPLGMLFKVFESSKLVYDAHELETETEMSIFRKKVSKALERAIIPFVDLFVVVNDSIAQWYKAEYSLKDVHVIKNVPYKRNLAEIKSDVLRRKFGLDDDDILFIRQGILENTRGIDLILRAFSKVQKNKHIVFMGFGSLENLVRTYEQKFSNIHFQPAVKPEDVLYYTSSADIGIDLIENTCLNHHYCLPNKFFEYLLSGLPVIASDFPEMAKVIDKYKCGWRVEVSERAILELVERISRKEMEEMKANVIVARENFGWEYEDKKLREMYTKLVARTS